MAKNNSELFAEWAQQFLDCDPVEDHPAESEEQEKEQASENPNPSDPGSSVQDGGIKAEKSAAEQFADFVADRLG